MSPCSSTVPDRTRPWRHCPRTSRAGMSNSALAHVVVSGLATGCIYGLVAHRRASRGARSRVRGGGRRAPRLPRGADHHPARARRHAQGRPHHHARPLAGAAGGRRDGMDERRAAISPSLLEPAREHRSRARGPGIPRHHRRLPRAHALPRGALPLNSPGPCHARGRPEPECRSVDGHKRRARVFLRLGARGRGGRRGRSAHGPGDVPVHQDGAHRDQWLHGGGPGGLRLDAGRGGGRHVPRLDRESGAALPADGHPLLRALSGHDRHPRRAPPRPLRARRTEKSLVRGALLALATAGAVAWPLVAPRYLVFLATLVAINAVVAIGLNLLSGYTNQLSFGHAGFLAIGAYVAALVSIHIPALPVPVTLLAAGLATGLVGLALGIPCLRLEGLYLAMATLAFGFVVTEAIANLDGLTRGNDGLRVPLARLGPWALDTDGARYYLVVTVAAALIVAALNVAATRTGRAFLAIRTSEIAAQASGINAAAYKTVAFVLSAFYTGVAGGLFAFVVGFLSPDAFDVFLSVDFLVMIILGGLGSVLGSVAGAAIVTVLNDSLAGFQAFRPLIFGAIM